ncbi:hypothetical protein R80B4_02224 [Fibrobacteres bacterium R8-0-B4]
MPRSYINIGAFAKYPLAVYERVKLFPLLGLEYEASISGNIKCPRNRSRQAVSERRSRHHCYTI